MNTLRSGVFALLLAGIAIPAAQAAITSFEGGVSAQTAWRTAVGSYVFEDFDSFAVNAPITTLSALGLTFDPLFGGAQPGIYQHGVDNTPSGPKQLANFPGNCCITPTYQNGDLVAHVDTGLNLYAFAFWNGDPQGNATLRIYDQTNVLLGSVTAAVNTGAFSSFAGFVSTVAVGRLEFEGATGDGWNHYDDFHASFANPVPEPEIYAMLGLGLGLMGWVGRRRRKQIRTA